MLTKNYIYAVSTLIGTAVGAGIFGLPYVTAQAGFFPALILLIILGATMILLALMYGEITLRTLNKGRLVGYCGKYIGKNGKRMATLITLFSLYANVLAYIIISGIFLNALLSGYFGGNEFIYGLAMFALISIGIYINLKTVSIVELLMVVFLLMAIFGIFAKGIISVETSNLLTSDSSQFFLPFGVILFSLSFVSAVPQLEHMMKKRQKKIKSAIITSGIAIMIIYALFMAVVVGITGSDTSPETFFGLSQFMGDGVITLGLIFGVFAAATSYLIIGINLKEIFWYDFHFSKNKSWALACFIPVLIFVLGFRDFIAVINFTGGVAGGFVGILIIIIFYKAKKTGDLKPAYKISVPKIISALMVLIFVLGIVYQVVYRN
ncbi:MAG: aromatic amino acid transport family protein [Patescibacteria group bacterium]|nr:aromatic amino acid transport family protein [Patescibacteria group bacterium]